MGKDGTGVAQSQGQIYRGDMLSEAIRGRVREIIEGILVEELQAALGVGPYERKEGRSGYRHGTERRKLLSSFGPTEFDRPRGRMLEKDGSSKEWQSRMLGRYQRRSRRVDDAILAMYLGGVNTRRVKAVLKPLFGQAALSRSTVSRIVGRLPEDGLHRRGAPAPEGQGFL